MDVRTIRGAEWSPITRPGSYGVEGRVLYAGPGLFVAMLRFGERATIDPHAAPHKIDVVCVEGRGRVEVAGETADFSDGQAVHWPAGAVHCLSTDGHSMTTLMLEHVGPGSGL